MEEIFKPSLGFGRTISHFLPGLVVVISLFMFFEILSPYDLTLKVVQNSNYLLGIVTAAVVTGFILGLLLDLFYHHRVLEMMVYGKPWFNKLLSRFYKPTDYVERYAKLRENEDKFLKDRDSRAVSDYYYLPLIGTDVRSHLLEGAVHYAEFFSNMSFSMAIITLFLGLYIQKMLLLLRVPSPQVLSIAVFFTVISALMALGCLIVGGALHIQYRERKIELIKGALEFKRSL